MLSGFNTNYRHRGAVFHVQTENTTARGQSQMITHLYYGGTILASEKSPASGEEEDALRQQMERQHVAMLKALRDGDFDDLVVERLGAEILGESEKAETQPAPAPTDGAPTQWSRPRSGERLDVLVAEYLTSRGHTDPPAARTDTPRSAK